MFWLKKVVSFWLMPLPLCVVLLAAGLALARSTRWPRLGRRLLCAAAALLLFFSNELVGVALLRPLESCSPPIPEVAAGGGVPAAVSGCAFVVVLGSGNNDIPGLSATGRLSTSGLGRIVEAVRILGMVPNARLVLSGPGSKGRPSHASVLAEAAESLGVSPGRITLIDTARDTEDESHAVARFVGGRRTALVTSAWHMPRAALLFRRAGVAIVPCPADYLSGSSAPSPWAALAFDSEALSHSTLAVHEWIGILWIRLRGLF